MASKDQRWVLNIARASICVIIDSCTWGSRPNRAGLAQFSDCRVQGRIKTHKRIVRPQFLTDFVAADQLTGALQQQLQNSEGLLLQTYTAACLGESALLKVDLDGSK